MVGASSPSFIRSSPQFLGPKIPISTPSLAPAPVRFREPGFAAAYTSAEKEKPPYVCSSRMALPASLYEVLGISTGATCQEIKVAYRKLARVSHPDVAAIDRKEKSTDEFMKINAAYSTLSDPEKRADYDRKLFRRQRSFNSSSTTSTSAPTSPASSSTSGFSGHTRRTWETDQCW
ncbi:hypothetical protein HHK36_002964 [Tetracentron sinense]|uniref:J domain-containing protein n=1 Tax=Tetracentron sinense TaxID=13715 RepID=A0A834ZN84_TETSI|nr:hypothetical protein HHK36_002964 [Tetracentron sinense]